MKSIIISSILLLLILSCSSDDDASPSAQTIDDTISRVQMQQLVDSDNNNLRLLVEAAQADNDGDTNTINVQGLHFEGGLIVSAGLTSDSVLLVLVCSETNLNFPNTTEFVNHQNALGMAINYQGVSYVWSLPIYQSSENTFGGTAGSLYRFYNDFLKLKHDQAIALGIPNDSDLEQQYLSFANSQYWLGNSVHSSTPWEAYTMNFSLPETFQSGPVGVSHAVQATSLHQVRPIKLVTINP